MFEKMSPEVMLRIKRYGYLLVFIVPTLLLFAWNMAKTSANPNLWAWFPLFFIFGVIPILDYLIGEDSANPNEDEEALLLSRETYYRWLTMACFPVQLASLTFAGWVFAEGGVFSWPGQLGWFISTGVVGGIIAINVGHELIHKDEKLERWVGGFLLATVTYGGFKVEHIRGHHVNVSTPEDASSARFNQSLYQFLPHAYLHNFLNAWKLEAEYLERKGKTLFSLENELWYWYGFSLLLAIAGYALFGWMGVSFFVIQSFLAFTTLEVINYIEHYGLHRRKLENGKYEHPNPKHSWNSNYLLTNLLLFQLQRHSDHHANAKRRYQVLRHHDESPQLPSGYATMFVLALIPPLWKKVINPRVEAYYRDELEQLQS